MKKIYALFAAAGIGLGGYVAGRMLHGTSQERCTAFYREQSLQQEQAFQDVPVPSGLAAPGSLQCADTYSRTPAFKAVICRYEGTALAVTKTDILGKKLMGLQEIDLEQILGGKEATAQNIPQTIKVLPGSGK